MRQSHQREETSTGDPGASERTQVPNKEKHSPFSQGWELSGPRVWAYPEASTYPAKKKNSTEMHKF